MEKFSYKHKVSRIDIRDRGIYFIVEKYLYCDNGCVGRERTHECEYIDAQQLNELFDKYPFYRFCALTIKNKRYTMYELLDEEEKEVQLRVVVRGIDQTEYMNFEAPDGELQ